MITENVLKTLPFLVLFFSVSITKSPQKLIQ